MIDAAEVFADDADADQLDAADEQHHGDERRVAVHGVAEQQRAHDDEGAVDERKGGEREADVGPYAQRHGAEACDAFEREVPAPPSGEFRAAAATRGTRVFDDLGAIADPCEQAFHETPPLGQRAQRVDDLAVHQPEIADVLGHLDFGEAVVHAVVERGGHALHQRIAHAVGALRGDDLGTGEPAFDHRGDQGGRILQVGIDQDHGGAGGFVDAGGERGFLAEAPGEIDDAHARVAGRDVDQPVQRVVAAAVVDADDLETDRIDRFEDRQRCRKECVDCFRLVVERYDERYQRPSGVRGHTSPERSGSCCAVWIRSSSAAGRTTGVLIIVGRNRGFVTRIDAGVVGRVAA
ncbi:hypothetical protein L810_4649 [Burkholderia sp. AU4i]|nr:hypothetical protein L810_4649 [Burkholderia sp. AU4i]